ncbi:MAG: SDR family NAD(P)-dependent oxidoreductase [Mycobacterium sp.]
MRTIELGLSGKTYIIVGGSSGMGLAAAEAICAEGGQVALIARDEVRLDTVVKSFRVHGLAASGYAGDPSEPGVFDDMLAQILKGDPKRHWPCRRYCDLCRTGRSAGRPARTITRRLE